MSVEQTFEVICRDRHIHRYIYIYIYIYKSQLTTGWRRLIECLKLQVIFRKRATNRRVLLRKMTYEDKASYDSMPPCTACTACNTLQHTATHCNTWQHTATHTLYCMYCHPVLHVLHHHFCIYIYKSQLATPCTISPMYD